MNLTEDIVRLIEGINKEALKWYCHYDVKIVKPYTDNTWEYTITMERMNPDSMADPDAPRVWEHVYTKEAYGLFMLWNMLVDIYVEYKD